LDRGCMILVCINIKAMDETRASAVLDKVR
jgi:hypothetical protein